MVNTSNVVPIRRLGVAMNLEDLERVAKLFVAECYPEKEKLTEEMRLSRFILWLHLHKRRLGLMKEMTNGKVSQETSGD
jgi:hypothetical protein